VKQRGEKREGCAPPSLGIGLVVLQSLQVSIGILISSSRGQMGKLGSEQGGTQ
jgi:hypothetical protein